MGNHDLIYLQENPLSSPYLNSKATWLKDSIINTLEFRKNLLSKINFKNYYKLESIIFSHANPYVLNKMDNYDWSYLNTFEEV